MKLISMTDHVLEQFEKHSLDNKYSSFEFMISCNDYAKFLNQPLHLGMFIPCDLEGNVLEEPTIKAFTVNGKHHKNFYSLAIQQYQQAKDRVIFKGCVYDDNIKTVRPPNEYADMFYNWESAYDVELVIEDIVKHNLTLTKNANPILINKYE